jgi:hypothetical protein
LTDVEREPVRRQHAQARQRPVEPIEQERARRAGGAAREDDERDPLGVGATFDQVDEALQQHRGLAGAGSARHEQRAVGVVDHAPLGGVERGRGRAHARMVLRGSDKPAAASVRGPGVRSPRPEERGAR